MDKNICDISVILNGGHVVLTNLGATFIVMGREIINSKNPSNKVEDVLQNISQEK